MFPFEYSTGDSLMNFYSENVGTMDHSYAAISFDIKDFIRYVF